MKRMGLGVICILLLLQGAVAFAQEEEIVPLAYLCTGTVFNDVNASMYPPPMGETFCGYIEQFSTLGITSGCSVTPPLYCPDSNVTRAQMAIFITKAMDQVITGVTAGTGLSGGGTAGDVTLNVNTSQIQQRVAGTCTAGNAIRVVNANGSVTCQATGTGTVTQVGSGTGLTGGPITTTGTLSVQFAGTGTAGTASHSDHNHNTVYYTKAQVDALISTFESRIAALEAKLAKVTADADNIYITNANLHVRSGSGATDGAVNSLGNVIIGYNEMRTSGSDVNVRTGSHNLVVGSEHNFSSYGGIVVGNRNTISGNYSSVSGGDGNIAIGNWSSVSGGSLNTANGFHSSVSGGIGNVASASWSSVSGGWDNTASGSSSSVSGGRSNTASGHYSSVSGGYQRSVTGVDDWRAGTLFQDQ